MISERNIRFLAVLSMVALFVAGLGIGFSIHDLLIDSYRRGPHPAEPPEDRFAQELDLTSDQKHAVSKILEQGRASADKIMERTRPELDAIRDTMEARIADVLTPKQAKQYRELVKHRHHKHGKKGPPPKSFGPPPPPPPPSSR